MKFWFFPLLVGWLATDSLQATTRPSYNTKHQRTITTETPGRSGASARPRVPLASSFWKPGDHQGPKKVVIYRDRQVAHFFIGDKKIGQSPVATGRKGYETPAGTFRVTQKKVSHASNLYGSFVSASGKHIRNASAGQAAPSGARYVASPMPYFMRLTDCGVGMHAGYVPGVPASHGCIRLPKDMAQKFYHALPIGSTVVIK